MNEIENCVSLCTHLILFLYTVTYSLNFGCVQHLLCIMVISCFFIYKFPTSILCALFFWDNSFYLCFLKISIFYLCICVAASGLSMACKIFIGVHRLSGCGADSVVMEHGLPALWRECRCWGIGTALGARLGCQDPELLGKECPGTQSCWGRGARNLELGTEKVLGTP